MKISSAILLLFITCTSFAPWQTDFEKAKSEAGKEHKLILLNFSGSDWCIPCIRMHKEFLDTDAFNEYASKNLVLLNADFPQLKKNQPDKKQMKANEALAEKYDPDGVFPFTVLLTADGKVIKSFSGLPKITPEEFINQLKP